MVRCCWIQGLAAAMKSAGCGKVFPDVASGVADARPGLAEALAYVRDGDTLVVWKLDRLGRSLRHLIDTVNALSGRGNSVAEVCHSMQVSRATRHPQMLRVISGPSPDVIL